MTGLDGNAIAALLVDAFGEDMTNALGTCGHCGARSRLAEAMVYIGAGTALRCPTCKELLMVIAPLADFIVVDAMGLSALQRPGLERGP